MAKARGLMQRDVAGLWDSRMSAAPVETPFSARQSRPAKRPNVVFLLADDLGWGDLSCYGSLHIRTPNLDRLAHGGVRFTHAYSASPWCSPMRVALYTGRNPGRLPVGLQEPLTTRDEHSGIPADHPTLASMLREAGYATAMFGKWHCGWLPWFSPLRIGFEVFFGNLDGAMDYFCHLDTAGQPDLYEGETPVELEGYYTWLVADRTVEFLRAQTNDQPFYVQVNWNAPHWPWEGPGDAHVGDAMAQRLAAGERNPLRHSDGGSIAKYAELVEAMDGGIGRILDALDAQGLADDTIVVFCSDNGGERYSFMWPFVGEKGDLTEGGIRVPFIARWPAAINGGQWSDATSITMDWTATLLDAAGVTVDDGLPLDGVSLLPWLLDGDEHPDSTLFWRTSSQGALRKGRYKYLVDNRPHAGLGSWPLFAGTRHLLFDLASDGREYADLSGEHPELLAEMKAEWEARAAMLLRYPDDHYALPGNVISKLASSRPAQTVGWSD
jgi:arylsulfatase A-like enzyme